MSGSCTAFADDVKFITTVTDKNHAVAQGVVNVVCKWSESQDMPLSIDKSIVLHCGSNNPRLKYTTLIKALIKVLSYTVSYTTLIKALIKVLSYTMGLITLA